MGCERFSIPIFFGHSLNGTLIFHVEHSILAAVCWLFSNYLFITLLQPSVRLFKVCFRVCVPVSFSFSLFVYVSPIVTVCLFPRRVGHIWKHSHNSIVSILCLASLCGALVQCSGQLFCFNEQSLSVRPVSNGCLLNVMLFWIELRIRTWNQLKNIRQQEVKWSTNPFVFRG